MKQVLFLCSGNYYRSRFAEIYFNWHARNRGLSWWAESRGLKLDARNPGLISQYTVSTLAKLGISCDAYLRAPLPATVADFAAAHRVIAVKESEHRSLVEAQFGAWCGIVEYWRIDDLDCAMPSDALPLLERTVGDLLERLAAMAA